MLSLKYEEEPTLGCFPSRQIIGSTTIQLDDHDFYLILMTNAIVG